MNHRRIFRSTAKMWWMTVALLPQLAWSLTYHVTAPKNFRPGRNYSVSVTFVDTTASSEVKAMLISYPYAWKVEEEANTGPIILASLTQRITGHGVINLMVSDEIAEDREFKLNVSAVGDVQFDNSTQLTLQTKTMSFFVQTDKSRYKPGDTLQFRVIVTGLDLKPIKDPMDIAIYDAGENRIKQWLDETPPEGFFTGSLPISNQPVLGLWKIIVKVDDKETEKTFKVEEYVLPKFKVEVNLLPYLLHQMESMPITVKANYTFGKPVEGDVLVIVHQAPGIDCYDPYDPASKEAYPYMRRDPCKVQTYKQSLKDGQFSTSISHKELQGLLMVGCYQGGGCDTRTPTFDYKSFMVKANVTEWATQITLSGVSTIDVAAHSLDITVLDTTPNSYKSGLKFKAWFKVGRPDGQPPAKEDYQGKMKVSVHSFCPYHGYGRPFFNDEETTTVNPEPCETLIEQGPTFDINLAEYPDGVIPYVLPTTIQPKYDSFNIQLELVDKYGITIQASTSVINKFTTKTLQNIQIDMNALPTLKGGSTVTFKIKCTEDIEKFYYQLLAKGEMILLDSMIKSATAKKDHELTLDLDAVLAQQLSPTAKLVVFYFTTTDDGRLEAIADSVSFNVDAVFAYDTTVEFSKSELEPAEQVLVRGSAAPDSTVALLAVDQSVLLLESGNDITADTVAQEVSQYDTNSGYYPYLFRGGWKGKRKRRSIIYGCFPIFVGGSNIVEMLRQVGMVLMCDCVQDGGVPRNDDYVDYEFDDDFELAGALPPESSFDEAPPISRGQTGKTMRTRQLFPETWIWNQLDSGNGKFEVPVTAPDTITSWVLSAFSVNSRLGLSVADTAKVTVFQPFFVRLSLPYSVVRGEQFALKMTVFNYLPSDQDVTVALDKSAVFKVIVDGVEGFSRVEQVIKVKSQSTGTVVVWVVPVGLGHLPLKVSASCSQAGDIVQASILTKAEGVPKTYTVSSYQKVSSASSTVVKYTPELPQNYVQGSEHVAITVVGDIMGSSMENLEDLVRMPYGCGEQNMVNFAPNIYVLNYLTETGQDKEAVKQNAIKYMDAGYQRELQYMRTDGSFSAFGNNDDTGSTWLTAFVVRCFSQAQPYIDVDPVIVDKSIDFLISVQQKDGSFQKIGFVHHAELKGGAGSGVALTAYVTIALLEASKLSVSTKLPDVIKHAVLYLEGQVDPSREDAYTLSLITYTLTLAKSNQANYALNQLTALAVNRGGQMYWADDQTQSVKEDENVPAWERYQVTPSRDIETAAYALMSILINKQDAIPVVRYLTSNQNAVGGFSSTQDTILALESLAMFASDLYKKGDTQNVHVEVLYKNKAHSFDTISPTNAAVLQTYEVPSGEQKMSEITVTATGTGIVVIQMTVTYNILEAQDSKKIVLDVKSDSKENTITVSVCMSYGGETESGMSIMEVNSLSGYYPSGVAALLDKYRDSGLKRVEVEGSKLVTYWDEISKAKKCMTVEQERADSVMKHQDALVAAYLYYSPEVQQTVLYKPAALTSMNLCDSCPDCEGCEFKSSASRSLSINILTCLALLYAISLC